MKHTTALLFALGLAGCMSVPPSPPAGSAPASGPAPAAPAAPAPVTPAPAPESPTASDSSAPAPGTGHNSPAYFLALVQGDSDLIDTEKYATGRSRLVADARAQAEHCLALAPQDGQCLYARGIVYGLAAREQPVLAASMLKSMLDSLAKAEAVSPGIDHAGPARLQAIVLLRAPSWPLGPGDVEAAVAAAKRAVGIEPTFAANQDILREAQKKLATPQ